MGWVPGYHLNPRIQLTLTHSKSPRSGGFQTRLGRCGPGYTTTPTIPATDACPFPRTPLSLQHVIPSEAEGSEPPIPQPPPPSRQTANSHPAVVGMSRSSQPSLKDHVFVIDHRTTAPDQRLARFSVDNAFQTRRIVGIEVGAIQLRLGEVKGRKVAIPGKVGTGDFLRSEKTRQRGLSS